MSLSHTDKTPSPVPTEDEKHQIGSAGLVLPLDEQDERSIWRYIKDNRRAVGWCIYILVLMVAFGFDGLLTGSLVGVPAFKKAFGVYDEASGLYIIRAIWQSLWTALTAAAMIIGSLLAGVLQPRFGIRATILAAMVFSIGAILFEQLCHGPAQFLGAKCVAGISYGLQMTTAIVTMPSFAPTRLRGPLGACLNTFILIGGWLAQGTLTGTGQVYPDSSKAYQIPFALQYIFVGIMLAGLPFVPEPVSHHLNENDMDGARAALTRLHGGSRTPLVERELQLAVFQHNLEQQRAQGARVALFEPLYRVNIQRTMVSAGLLGFQQLVGGTFVTSYLTYFFQVAGAPEDLSLSLGEMSFTVQLCGNLLSWYTIDKLGRRGSLVGGLAAMTVTLIIIGITWAVRSAASLWCMVAFMTIWAFFYQATIGACGFSVASETPSPRLRAATIGYAMSMSQVCAWAMGFATPYMINPDEANLGGYVGFVFAGLCGLATIWAFFAIPETSGRTLAETDEMWSAKVPVRKWKGYVCESARVEL